MKAVMIFGQPGSGKGTQADLLEEKNQFTHFDTGRFLEAMINDPKNANDAKIQEEKKLFDSGILMSPDFVLDFVNKKTTELAQAGKSIVFSGSPRTEYEVLGDEKTSGLIFTIEKLYPKAEIYALVINVSDQTSIDRNSKRMICVKTGKPVLKEEDCDGPVRHRTLDNPEVIKKRLVEYRERTVPALKALEAQGHRIYEVDGEKTPEEVREQILKLLNL